MAIDPRRLRPSELCRLVNSTPLGTVLDERQLHRHRTRAGFRIGDATHVDLFCYVARLAVAMGDRGCLSLFGQRREEHRLFAEHVTAEYRVKTEGRGRTVDEWKLRVSAGDNHWLVSVRKTIFGWIYRGISRKSSAKI